MDRPLKKIGLIVTRDLLFCLAALGLMNAVLQLFVYPGINRSLGEESYGSILYLIGIISLFSATFGNAVNNSRLVERNKYEVSNGDADTVLLICGIFSVSVTLAVVHSDLHGAVEFVLCAFLVILTMLRYYSDVAYRLTVNYKKYFVYYAVLSLFYVIGFALFHFTGVWFLIFMIGEASAVIFAAADGKLFGGIFHRTENFPVFLKSSLILASSYLIYNFIVFADRIILSKFVGDAAVSQYYVVSLIGKTAAIVVSSLNSLIIGYITKKKITFSKKSFLKIIGLTLAVGAVFLIASLIILPVFIKLFYPEMYDSVKSLIFVVSLSQIICFLVNPLLTIILTFAHSRWQLIVRVPYGVLFAALGIAAARKGGIVAFSYAALTANIFQFIFTCAVGLKKAGVYPINRTLDR